MGDMVTQIIGKKSSSDRIPSLSSTHVQWIHPTMHVWFGTQYRYTYSLFKCESVFYLHFVKLDFYDKLVIMDLYFWGLLKYWFFANQFPYLLI